MLEPWTRCRCSRSTVVLYNTDCTTFVIMHVWIWIERPAQILWENGSRQHTSTSKFWFRKIHVISLISMPLCDDSNWIIYWNLIVSSLVQAALSRVKFYHLLESWVKILKAHPFQKEFSFQFSNIQCHWSPCMSLLAWLRYLDIVASCSRPRLLFSCERMGRIPDRFVRLFNSTSTIYTQV